MTAKKLDILFWALIVAVILLAIYVLIRGV